MKDTFYFKHDYNARQDPKLQRLMMKHGVAGLGIYWCIVEMMYEQGGRLENNYIDVIAYNLHIDKTTIEEVVFELNLFVFDDTHFWHDRVCQTLCNRDCFKTTQKQRAGKGGAPKGNSNARKNNPKTTENNSNCLDLEQVALVSENNPKQPKTTKNNLVVFDDENKTTENNPIIRGEEIRGDNISSSLCSEDIESIGAKRTAFVPPTSREVEGYVEERGYSGFDAERFIDFYTSKGWMVGKNRMKDWRAAVRNWWKSEADSHRQPTARQVTNNNINDEWQ